MKYIQRIDFNGGDEDIILEKDVIIYRAVLNCNDYGKDLLKNNSIQIIDAGIVIESEEGIPEKFEFSDSIRRSLKKISIKVEHIYLYSDDEDMCNGERNPKTLVALAKTLSKDFEVKVILKQSLYQNTISYLLQNLPRGIELEVPERDDYFDRFAIRNGDLFYMNEGEYYKLTTKLVHLYFQRDEVFENNNDYFVIDQNKTYDIYYKDFECRKVNKDDVNHSTRLYLKMIEEGDKVLENKDLCMNPINSFYENELEILRKFDVSTVGKGDLLLQESSISGLETIQNFTHSPTLIDGTLHFDIGSLFKIIICLLF